MSTSIKIYQTLILGSVFLPFWASAQSSTPDPGKVGTILTNIIANATTVIQVLFIFASLVFLWGVITYIAKSDDEAARKKARSLMAWGIIGLAVMSAAWGVTRLLVSYFGVGGGSVPSTFQ